MKKKATARPAKAASRQSTLNFPTSSEADLVAESTAAETATKSGAKNRRKRTADFADATDKPNKPQCDLSAISSQSAVKIDAPQIPNGWCWTTFKDATVNFDGQRVPIKKEDRERRSGEYPYYGASGVIDDIDDFLFDGEFLLVAEDGANLLSRSTPIAFRASGKFWVNNHAHVVQPANGVALRFIEYYLNSIDLKFFVSGSAQPKLNQANLNKIPIPLPSLPEQHRIVAEIEKQFTRLDAGVAALKRVQANLKRYRAAVLKAACEGKLVPTEAELARREGRTYETGEQLLQRVLTERRQSWQDRGKYKEPVLRDSDYLGRVPEGWTVGSISQIAECLDSRRIPINKAQRLQRLGEIPYYGANGRVGWIDAHLFDETLVLVVEDETFVGRALPFSYLIHGKSWVNNHAHVLRATSAILPAYLNYSLAYYPFTARTTGSTGRRKLTQQALMESPFLLPPLAEQIRIVAESDLRLSVVEELEAVVAANLLRATRLRQSILQTAFTGNL